MKQYLELMQEILTKGADKPDRTGVGTYSLFGKQLRFNLKEGFPLITTKKIHTKSLIYELLWMLKGDTNVKYLNDRGVTIWNEWANSEGNLGPIYGAQWRRWQAIKPIDQLNEAIIQIKQTPGSRRIIVCSWNVGELNKMALPPCHLLFQFYIINKELSCQMYQRSADYFLGVPFNIASYAILTGLIAQVTNLVPSELIICFGDVHLYKNHIEQVKLQLSRSPLELPQLELNTNITNIDDFKYEDIKINNYKYYPAIPAPIAV